MLCSLGNTPDIREPPHFHDPCFCLDTHQWTAALGNACANCGVQRCTVTRAAGVTQQRCTRGAVRHRQHLYTRS